MILNLLPVPPNVRYETVDDLRDDHRRFRDTCAVQYNTNLCRIQFIRVLANAAAFAIENHGTSIIFYDTTSSMCILYGSVLDTLS